MKIKLQVSEEKYAKLEKQLQSCGIQVDDSADYILYEANTFSDYLAVKGERIRVADVVYIESYGHDIIAHTMDDQYKLTDRLWQLEKNLNPSAFLRISNSVIISCKCVKSIKPALSQKFMLTLTNGSIVDVTRSYYYIFKERFGI